MVESTLTDKGQTTVPKKVRDALGIQPRQKLQWDVDAEGTVRVRAEPSVLTLFGSLKPQKQFPGIQEEKAAVRALMAEQAADEDGEQ